jgi:hypothetical protein
MAMEIPQVSESFLPDNESGVSPFLEAAICRHAIQNNEDMQIPKKNIFIGERSSFIVERALGRRKRREAGVAVPFADVF